MDQLVALSNTNPHEMAIGMATARSLESMSLTWLENGQITKGKFRHIPHMCSRPDPSPLARRRTVRFTVRGADRPPGCPTLL